MLIGSYTGDRGRGRGIAVVPTDGGIPTHVERVIPAESPSFLARHPHLPVFYAVAESPRGRVVGWSPDGAETSGDTGGADPCHLSVDTSGRFLVTANYGGSVAVHRLDPDGRIGERTDLVTHDLVGPHARQATAHPHMVRATGDGVLVVDLGADAIYRYRLDDGRLSPTGMVATPPGSGPRHLTRAGGRWLVAAELSAEVLVYDADWAPLGRVPATRHDGYCLVSELVATDRFLYVGNRGADTVSVFTLGGELPAYVTEVPTGAGPRHIALGGDLLHVANELSDELITMRVDPVSGVPEQVAVLSVPSPTCVLR